MGSCREGKAAAPSPQPWGANKAAFHTPGFGLETAPLGLQQLLYHKLVGPWECKEALASLCVLLAGSDGLLSPLWGAGTWEELAGSQIWPF